MKLPFSKSFLAGALCTALFTSAFTLASRQEQGKQPAGAQNEMAAMMEKAARFVRPGKNHKELERFLGKWNTETRFAGSDRAEKGTCEFAWLMDGRWLKGEAKGSFMGKPSHQFYLFGYDNFRQSFVTCAVNTMDTAMLHSEGDMDPSDKMLITYGTLDEYLTGEIAKMVKYVWRFESKDRIVLEIHDLPIGAENTKVVEIIYTRA